MTVLRETKVNHAGLMRCCLQSLGIYADEEEPEREATDGLIHRCRYCDEPMILEHGTWRWLRPEEEQ